MASELLIEVTLWGCFLPRVELMRHEIMMSGGDFSQGKVEHGVGAVMSVTSTDLTDTPLVVGFLLREGLRVQCFHVQNLLSYIILSEY